MNNPIVTLDCYYSFSYRDDLIECYKDEATGEKVICADKLYEYASNAHLFDQNSFPERIVIKVYASMPGAPRVHRIEDPTMNSLLESNHVLINGEVELVYDYVREFFEDLDPGYEVLYFTVDIEDKP